MGKTKKIKNLKGKKLKIDVKDPEMERMRMHSNEMQDKIKELVRNVNAINKRI